MYAQACEKDASSMTIFHTPGHRADVIFSISWGSLVKIEQTQIWVYLPSSSIPQPHSGGLFLLLGFMLSDGMVMRSF